MKNITVSVDEETHRLARIRAAELDTSVSALVRNYLRSLVSATKGRPHIHIARRGNRGRTPAEEAARGHCGLFTPLRVDSGPPITCPARSYTTGPEPGLKRRHGPPPKTSTANVGERRALCRYERADIRGQSRCRTKRTSRTRRSELLEGGDLALSVQVLQEFYHQATRSNRPGSD